MGDCVFCDIVAGELPAKVYYQDDDVIAFADQMPVAPTHALIVSKKHIESVEHLSAEDEQLIGHMLLVASEVARSLGVAVSGYRLVVNIGADGGQLVPHLHIHLLGGRALAPQLG